MSHFTTIKTQIQDERALQAACGELGLQLIDNTNARGYGDTQRHGDLVIRLTGPYDIALNRDPEGAYELTTDWWDGHVEREVGKNFGRLLQLYAVNKASREAVGRGYVVKRQPLENGSIKLTIGGM